MSELYKLKTNSFKKKTSRKKAEILSADECTKFVALKKKYKIGNEEIARMLGTSKSVVSGWGKEIPAKCRALLELWDLKDKIQLGIKNKQ